MLARTLPSGQLLCYFYDMATFLYIFPRYASRLVSPLGFDIEYKPTRVRGAPQHKTALLQLASSSLILLIQLSAMSEFPYLLKTIIEDPAIIKAGVGIKDDMIKLWCDFGVCAGGCVELSALARAIDPIWADWHGMIGLARLLRTYKNHTISKPKHIQLSNWEELPLTSGQQRYAAEDANAGLAVFQQLSALLPSVSPAPAETTYCFHITLTGNAETLAGGPFPPRRRSFVPYFRSRTRAGVQKQLLEEETGESLGC